MPSKIYIAAQAITSGVMIPEDDPTDHKPVLVMSFLPGLAEAITSQVFEPHTGPENFIVGINPSGLMFEITLYCVVTIDDTVQLPIPQGMNASVIKTTGQLESPYTYVIGCEADLDVEGLTTFITRKDERGHFFVACGAVDDSSSDPRLVGDWMVQCDTIYGTDVGARLEQAV